MLQRGDLVVERLTGNRAIVIHVTGADEVTCRFGDGRLEDRFAFELEPAVSFLEALSSALLGPLFGRTRERPAPVGERPRPLLVRQPAS